MRRYDEIIIDIPRKTMSVDDTVLLDEKLADHWWMIDYLELMGKNGIVLNPEKLQFAQKQIDLAGSSYPLLNPKQSHRKNLSKL